MTRKLPAYPLFIKDPNFSIWQATEELNAQNAETWFGEKKGIYGFLKSKGKTWCFMGNAAQFSAFGVLPAKQTDLSVSLFSTEFAHPRMYWERITPEFPRADSKTDFENCFINDDTES